MAKRDRLGRDPIIVAMIEASVRGKGGRVVSAAGEGTDDDSPASILMRRVIDGVAEYERLVNKVRTCSALAAKRARGERTGSVPFGFELADDGRRLKSGRPVALVVSPGDAATAQAIGQLRAEGLSLRNIAAELDRRGVAPKQGAARWSHSAVAKILARLDGESGPSRSSITFTTRSVDDAAPSQAHQGTDVAPVDHPPAAGAYRGERPDAL